MKFTDFVDSGVPFGTLSIFASGTATPRPKVALSRDLSLKQSYVVTVRMSREELKLVKKWVDENFGAKTPGYYNPRWNSDGYSKWCFKKEADALLFIMRWS